MFCIVRAFIFCLALFFFSFWKKYWWWIYVTVNTLCYNYTLLEEVSFHKLKVYRLENVVLKLEYKLLGRWSLYIDRTLNRTPYAYRDSWPYGLTQNSKEFGFVILFDKRKSIMIFIVCLKLSIYSIFPFVESFKCCCPLIFALVLYIPTTQMKINKFYRR